MRSIKTLAAAAFLAVSVTTIADAQARPFRDSWFWGVRAGAMSYTAIDVTDPSLPTVTSFAPTIGGDWLITRTKGGLYMGFSQGFMTTQGVILNGPTSADTGFRAVDVKNLRQFNLMAMAFPGDFLRFHPYVGGGFAFRYLGNATAAGPYTQQKQMDYAASAVNDVKAAIGPSFIAGGQYRLKALSVFGQLMANSMARNFLLANGHTMSYGAEFGVRYNLGSSIER